MKTKHTYHALCSAVLLACSAGAWAQAATVQQPPSLPALPAPPAPVDAPMLLALADAAHAPTDIEVISASDRSERRISGAPYCADAVTEIVQPLMDGNRIVKKTTTRLCRDGEGRTRQESDAGGTPRVYIHDPVAKRHWIMDVKNKAAIQVSAASAFPTLTGNPLANNQWQAYGDMMRTWAEKVSHRVKTEAGDGSATPRPVVITEVRREVRGDGKGAPRVETEIHINHVNKDGTLVGMAPMAPAAPAAPGAPPAPPTPAAPPMPPMPPMPAIDTLQAMPGVTMIRTLGNRGPGTTTSLGAKEVEGVKANGERTTWTIEAGKLGNEKPIVITSEKWTSPDLMLTLSTREVDPRTGEKSYRLSNLKRGEPDAALFKVPADYKLTEGAVRETSVRTFRRTPAASAPTPAPKAQ